MRKKIKLAILVSGLLAVAGIGLLISNNSNSENSSTSEKSSQAETTIVDIDVSEDGKTVTYPGVTGETALETLRNAAAISTQSSAFGDYVTAIEGVESVNAESYWAFYVNDEYATVGAGDYVAVEGDTFKWMLEDIE